MAPCFAEHYSRLQQRVDPVTTFHEHPSVAVQVRVFELSQLSLKFERHLDSQIVQFQVRLSPFLHPHQALTHLWQTIILDLHLPISN